jgi:hypothetical protein
VVSTPTQIDPAPLGTSLRELRRTDGKAALRWTVALDGELARSLDIRQTRTRMEQFYRLLHLIQGAARDGEREGIDLDPAGARAILLGSGVFSDPAIPGRIQAISVRFPDARTARFTVTFAEKGTEIELNRGGGFLLFRNGKCQHAKKLIFDRSFSFTTAINRDKNLVASDFRGVDLFGDFGNRGVVDIDVQYVALQAVEFYAGTPLGEVTALISPEEFVRNRHNVLLELVSRFLPDRSVQPIDW